ncbi:MAG: putative outer membrane repeat protein, partial [Limisphaerales bacterium]
MLFHFKVFSSAIFVLIVSSFNLYSATWFVSPGATGSGTSWLDASGDLRTTILSAVPGDEVWVVQGIYNPDSTNKNRSFKMRNGVGVYGGFTGVELTREERNFSANKTYLSGDLLSDDGVDFSNRTDNSFRVVESIGTNAATILDGFEIRGGHAYGGIITGAGIYLEGSDMVIRNCVITKNDAKLSGGGLYAIGMGLTPSNPTIEFAFFVDNFAGQDGGGAYIISADTFSIKKSAFLRNESVFQGGGLYCPNSEGSVTETRFIGNVANNGGAAAITGSGTGPEFSRCVIKKNDAIENGGGIYANFVNPSLSSCLLQQNEAGFSGGGVYIRGDNVSISGCGFIANKAEIDGGGVWVHIEDDFPIVNCVFLGNFAVSNGGGFYSAGIQDLILSNSSFSGNSALGLGGAICSGFLSNVEISNSVLWANSSEIASLSAFSNPVTYSDMAGAYSGIGNIDADPLFVLTPNYLLAPTKIGDLRPTDGSPLIDAGSDTEVPAGIVEDVLGKNRFVGVTDMGAYEYPFSLTSVLESKISQIDQEQEYQINIFNYQHSLQINPGDFDANQVIVYNQSGQIILQSRLTGTQNFNTSEFSIGL